MRKFETDLGWKKHLVVLAILLLVIVQFVAAQNLGNCSAIQCSGSGRDRCPTGRQFPEPDQLDRQRDRPRRRRGCGRGRRRVLANGTRLCSLVVRRWRPFVGVRCHTSGRVLDHERNRRHNLAHASRRRRRKPKQAARNSSETTRAATNQDGFCAGKSRE